MRRISPSPSPNVGTENPKFPKSMIYLKSAFSSLKFILFAGMLALPLTINAGTITTPEIISKSLSQNCLDWKVSGVCIWLKCTIFGCFVVTTPKISHRLPDFVVSAYPNTTHSPWVEFRSILTATVGQMDQLLLSGGHLTGKSTNKLHQDVLKFNEVDVIGNPGLGLLKFGKFLCKSDVSPLQPYFTSISDAAAWRSGMPDATRREAQTPGLREIGNWPKSTWGSVYPRSGFVLQQDPAKAAAVASLRAIDIVTRDFSGHLIVKSAKSGARDIKVGDQKASNKNSCEISGGNWNAGTKNQSSCEQQIWRQWSGKESDLGANWQMLLPKNESRCEAFGGEGSWSMGKIADDGNYVWNYWRRYQCCIKGGGKLLKSVDL